MYPKHRCRTRLGLTRQSGLVLANVGSTSSADIGSAGQEQELDSSEFLAWCGQVWADSSEVGWVRLDLGCFDQTWAVSVHTPWILPNLGRLPPHVRRFWHNMGGFGQVWSTFGKVSTNIVNMSAGFGRARLYLPRVGLSIWRTLSGRIKIGLVLAEFLLASTRFGLGSAISTALGSVSVKSLAVPANIELRAARVVMGSTKLRPILINIGWWSGGRRNRRQIGQTWVWDVASPWRSAQRWANNRPTIMRANNRLATSGTVRLSAFGRKRAKHW